MGSVFPRIRFGKCGFRLPAFPRGTRQELVSCAVLTISDATGIHVCDIYTNIHTIVCETLSFGAIKIHQMRSLPSWCFQSRAEDRTETIDSNARSMCRGSSG